MLTEDEFAAKYDPQQKQPDLDLFDFEDVKDLPAERVWTIVESGGWPDHWYALPGFHIVNKLGYVTSETPWTDDGETALWFESPGVELSNYDSEHQRFVLNVPAYDEVIIHRDEDGVVHVLDSDGNDAAEDLRSLFEANGYDKAFDYLTGVYLTTVAEVYAAALTDQESETRQAQIAAMQVPTVPKEDN